MYRFLSTFVFIGTSVLLLSGCHGGGIAGLVRGSGAGPGSGGSAVLRLLNVSYDPTRELYKEYNAAFCAQYQKSTAHALSIEMSHGGSGAQARKVVNGQDADVVTLASAYDIDSIADAGLTSQRWEKRLPNNSAPYTSTIVFLVRRGNPRHIADWNDLIRPGISVVTANPATSGGARWDYLAAWGYAMHQTGGSDATARDFVRRLYANVAVMDAGSRAAATTFIKNGIGDVMIAWENEALLNTKGASGAGVQLVIPSESIVAEPPVTVVDANATKHGTTGVASEYLSYLYSPRGQEIIARNFYRPRDPAVLARFRQQFPPVKTWSLQSVFGDWREVYRKHFAPGGVFDQIKPEN